MKLALRSLMIVLFLGLISCKKGPDIRPKLSAMLGKWTIKTVKCYQDPFYIGFPPDAYFKFNSDLTGYVYDGSITNQYENFSFILLDDDSTLIIRLGSANYWDTSVITTLSATQFIFHGINTYAHGFNACTNGNSLDSLYR